ncbi:PTS lactose/cellobiose transporter subunit IIA, partial [Virgibacillus dokdonensis]
HIMTAQAEIQLIKRMVTQLRKTESIEKRLEKLEKN